MIPLSQLMDLEIEITHPPYCPTTIQTLPCKLACLPLLLMLLGSPVSLSARLSLWKVSPGESESFVGKEFRRCPWVLRIPIL